MRIIDALLGRRLANRETASRRLGALEAVPAMGLDALGSSSYGPEAALTVLLPLGAASLSAIGPITGAIVLLLALLYLSYRQTVVAYPSNGGAYRVAHDNLGRTAGLLAAAALMVDYTLNVAVGISAGVGALISSVPALQPYRLWICLAVLVLVTLANLRGTREAGWLFAVPTYTFLASFLGLMGWGLWTVAATGGHPEPLVAPPAMAEATEALGLWLVLRAFAAGCTAMTGVEAVSNGVGSLKEPVTRQAHLTLTILCVALAALLAGGAVLARAYGLVATDQSQPGYQSIMSQLAGAVAGHGVIYYVAMASLLAILCLSANTSFVGFPRLCRVVAADGFLPRSFAQADRRLVFSVGIGVLTVSAGLLLVVFDGVTDRLIPLFAVGAFLSFTLSQAGMVMHWRREGGNRSRLVLNGLGAVATASALVVIMVAKFAEGAWITAAVIPLTVWLLQAIGRYHERLDAELRVEGDFRAGETEPPIVLVAVEERNRMSDAALRFAMTLSPDVIAIHLLRLEGPEAEEDGKALKQGWQREVVDPLGAAGTAKAPRLVLLPAPFRESHGPLLKLVEKLDEDSPGRSIAVLIPELVRRRWWERFLRMSRAERLRGALLEHGPDRLNVITTPWRR